MFVLRYCVCVSVGLLAALSLETSSLAQTQLSMAETSEAAKLRLDPQIPLKSQPRVSDIKQMKAASGKPALDDAQEL